MSTARCLLSVDGMTLKIHWDPLLSTTWVCLQWLFYAWLVL
eukprot:SAG11_NODE_5874_length_1443_cov_1.308036_3_plen_41_part_01